MEMKHANRFLTAEWKNLVMLNYAVDASLLERFVPVGTELDSFEGSTYLSLVGFQFNRSRIFGFPVPFHQAFEEVNLRFYVRRSSKRGVVFIRELVPKYAVAAIARFAFNENYSCVPMSHRIEPSAEGDVVQAEYAWGSGSDRCLMRIETEGPSFLPADGSASQFITEHYWGYAAQPGAAAWNMKSNMFDGVSRTRNGQNSLGAWTGSMGSRWHKLSCVIRIPLSWPKALP
jgi:uncharacterized protein YqjF (DUF2071 family)